ncbi:MAG: hypothetical protein WBE13_14395 [Candidatus Acidiferrum sp.]
MLTFFTTAKPFVGHIGVIQRNALKSWTMLHPDIEVTLFGDDEAASAVAKEFRIRHETSVDEGVEKTRRADFMFRRAREIARHEVLCYANCDIVLMSDFREAVGRVSAAHSKFLMVGRRWDTDIREPIDFNAADWEGRIRHLALKGGLQQDGGWIDYLAFSRVAYGADFPALVVGQVRWDNWMVWKALEDGYPVVNASAVVAVVHQNHDHSHHPEGKRGVWEGEEARRNLEQAGGWRRLRLIGGATEVLRLRGLKKNWLRHWISFERRADEVRRLLLYRCWNPVWFFLLDLFRPIRTAMGLRRKSTRHPE